MKSADFKKLLLIPLFSFLVGIVFAQDPFVPRYDAVKRSERCFTITWEENNQFGAVWWREKVDFAKDTAFNFVVYMGDRDGNGADGIAFVMHQDPRDTVIDKSQQVNIGGAGSWDLSGATGDDGGGLGFAMHNSRVNNNQIPGPHADNKENHKIQPSVAIEFDTWDNGDVQDGNSGFNGSFKYWQKSPFKGQDHTSVVYNGDLYGGQQTIEDAEGRKDRILPLKPAYAFGGDYNPDGSVSHNIEDDQCYLYQINWLVNPDGTQSLQLWADVYDGSTNTSNLKLIMTHTDDIINNVFGGNTLMRFGFTGSTGGAINEQTICLLGENLKPFAEDDYASVSFNSSTVVDVEQNDNDPDGDQLHVPIIIDTPKNGSAVIFDSLDVNFMRYTPNANYIGMDTISYVTCDVNSTKAYAKCDTAEVVLEILDAEEELDVEFQMPQSTMVGYDFLDFPVKVNNFENILTTQFTITWDPEVVEYQCIRDFALPYLEESDFHLFDTGTLTFSWSPDDGLPVSVPENSALFNIVFKCVGLADEETLVRFVDDPTSREVADADMKIVDATYSEGTIKILDHVTLGGYIKTQKGEPLVGIEVEMIGGLELTTTTDEKGWYEFSVVPNLEYHIAPLFDTQDDDGVTTLDIVIMHWHILGKKYMMSNKDLIACDVNSSGSLTSLDLAETRSVVLHNHGDKFRGKNSVEFINDEYTGDKEVFTYKNYLDIVPTVSHLDLNFTAVKRGDASRSWKPNKNKGGRDESLESIEIQLEENYISQSLVSVPMSINDFQDMIGLQFTLEWDPEVYQVESFNDGRLHLDVNFEWVEKGKLTVSWNTESYDGISLSSKDIISDLQFRKLNDDQPHLKVTSGITPALAYNSRLESFRISNQELSNELSDQNFKVYPNPAIDRINISGIDEISVRPYSIINSIGVMVQSGQLTGSSIININSLKKGMYVLQFVDHINGRTNLKFLKE